MTLKELENKLRLIRQMEGVNDNTLIGAKEESDYDNSLFNVYLDRLDYDQEKDIIFLENN